MKAARFRKTHGMCACWLVDTEELVLEKSREEWWSLEVGKERREDRNQMGNRQGKKRNECELPLRSRPRPVHQGPMKN